MTVNSLTRLLALSLLGVGLAACGGSDDPTPTPPDTDAADDTTGDVDPGTDAGEDTTPDTDPGTDTTPDADVDPGTDTDVEEPDTDAGTDTDVEEPVPVVDQCVNDDDLAILQPDNGASVTGIAQSCGLASLSEPDSRAAALECIVEDTGLTEGCAGCYADTVACSITNCLVQCGSDPSSAACGECQAENCLDDFFACRGDIEGDELGNIIEVATEAGTFTTLLAALDEAELTETLEGEGPFTVFAPSDDAFAAFLEENELTAEELLADENLAEILSYHVISGAAVASGEVEAGPILTFAGYTAIAGTEGGVTINGIDVVTPDIQASNGVIHVIDGVLIPLTIAELADLSGGFDTLLAAADAVSVDEGTTLADVLDSDEFSIDELEILPLTLFAPTDEAFTALLTEIELTAEQFLGVDGLFDILIYHTIIGSTVLAADVETSFPRMGLTGQSAVLSPEGDGWMINDANITATDLIGTNGVIHVIDSVIFPGTIAELLTWHPDFSTVVAAAGAAEAGEGLTIAEALDNDEAEFTLFAPTDAAFEAFLTDSGLTAEDLLADTNLAYILLSHATDGSVGSEAFVDGESVAMLSEFSALIAATAEGFSIAGADIDLSRVDIFASNGLIHVLNGVMDTVVPD